MKKTVRSTLSPLSIVLLVLLPSLASAANIAWQLSKNQAMNLAAQQGKRVLLLAGRDT